MLLLLVLGQGCAGPKLKPYVAPPPEASRETKEQAYKDYGVSLYQPTGWFEDLSLSKFSRRLMPIVRAQSQYVSGNFRGSAMLGDYFEASGALEAAEMAHRASAWDEAALVPQVGGLVLMVAGLNDVIFVKAHDSPSADPIFLSGVASAVLALWMQYHGSVSYLIPSVDSFDRFLRERLGLDIGGTPGDLGLQVSRAY
jgi:hypothetical protein